jgi:carboxymethylenebutenolidase
MPESTPLSVYEPSGPPKGGVIVIQEAFGANDHIEDVTRRFAAEGYVAVAPHLFHRTGDPKLGYGDMGEVMPHMQAVTKEGVLEDVDTAIAYLEKAGIPASKQGIVGFCMGGSVALQIDAVRTLGAAVTFYGGGLAEGRFGFDAGVEAAKNLQAPWLGLFGDLDKGIPAEQVEAVREAAKTSGQPSEVVRYAEAEHGFHCDQRPSYHAESATDAWKRTLAWFGKYLA